MISNIFWYVFWLYKIRRYFMKKILFLGIALTTLSVPALAQNWNYATQGRGYVSQYQQPVQRKVAQPYRQATRNPSGYIKVSEGTAQNRANYTNANNLSSSYKLGNPLYMPAQGHVFLNAGFNFLMVPEEKNIGQEEASGWEILGGFTFGVTDNLSLSIDGGYASSETDETKVETTSYGIRLGARYKVASVDGFDFNIGANLNIEKAEEDVGYASEDIRLSSTDIYLLMGKKMQNVSPYFKVGFNSSLWSEVNTGTSYFVQPGLYFDINQQVGLDLNVDIVENSNTAYNARLDFYPAENISLGVGFTFAAPNDSFGYYGLLTSAKFAF